MRKEEKRKGNRRKKDLSETEKKRDSWTERETRR